MISRCLWLANALVVLTVFGCPSNATTLKCAFQFVGSGTIGTQTFTNAEIAISTVGDTADVTGAIGTGRVSMPTQSTAIWVSGVGTFEINEPAGVSVQTAPIGGSSGSTVTQLVTLTLSGEDVASVTSITSAPWDLLSSYIGLPAFGQGPDGSFEFNPPGGQLKNWAVLPVLTAEGYDVTLQSTSELIPMTFQALITLSCSGTSEGSVAEVQAVVNEALGAQPVTVDLNGDGIVNVADIQAVTDFVLGCGTIRGTAARIERSVR